jgi:hypothetical protein
VFWALEAPYGASVMDRNGSPYGLPILWQKKKKKKNSGRHMRKKKVGGGLGFSGLGLKDFRVGF